MGYKGHKALIFQKQQGTLKPGVHYIGYGVFLVVLTDVAAILRDTRHSIKMFDWVILYIR